MADRKDVLDFLRNQQKAAEIEAKVNGVNLWVLFGALAVVLLQLISSDGTLLTGNHELGLRALVASECVIMLCWLLQQATGSRDELRYSRASLDDVELPLLVLVQAFLFLLPPAVLLFVAGPSFGILVLALIGLVFVGFGVAAVVRQIVPRPAKKDKFPKPDLGLTNQADAIGNLALCILFVVGLAEQGAFFRSVPGGVSAGQAKQLALLGTLYLLVWLVIERRLRSNNIAWTYELETELVLESVTPEVALRRIEHRRLGPRLQDIMDRFFDDLDVRSNALDSMLAECKGKVEAAKLVPEQYPEERTARIKRAAEPVSAQIDALVSDCSDFRVYLGKLEEKNVGARRRELAPLLASLKERHDSFDDRARTAKLELKRLLD